MKKKKEKNEPKKKGDNRDLCHAPSKSKDPKKKAEDTFAYWDKSNMERAKPLNIDREDDNNQ